MVVASKVLIKYNPLELSDSTASAVRKELSSRLWLSNITCMDTAYCQDGMSMWRKLVKNAENTLEQWSLPVSR